VTIAFGPKGIGVVVLDIEGTTTPISFVYDVLFPYARQHLPAFLAAHGREAQVVQAYSLLTGEHASDVAKGESPPPLGPDEALVPYLEWLMDRDSKSPGLKLIQGLLWKQGYEDGSLVSEIFPDVPPALERFDRMEMATAIYSSGSVLAQRLLFGHTRFGDLTGFIGHYFDTGVGPKRSPDSYHEIARRLDRSPAEILFVSDVVEELDAARVARFRTALCVRPGNPAQRPSVDVKIRSLEELTW
jgi:enolase-phosphatase E1